MSDDYQKPHDVFFVQKPDFVIYSNILCQKAIGENSVLINLYSDYEEMPDYFSVRR